jgi:hypothetical protein
LPRKHPAPVAKSTALAEAIAIINKNKPIAIAAAAIVLLLAIFVLPRCGQKPAPAKGSATQKKH